MKIYTKTGDDGDTGLFGGPRVPKDHARIESYGDVDELNSHLGVARAAELPPAIDTILARVQHELFALGSTLATPQPERHAIPQIGAEQIAALEADIDQYEETLPPLAQFILPGGTPGGAQLHLARTVCRRAERRLVTLRRAASEPIAAELLVYLNRLGDLLFVLARAANRSEGVPEEPWIKPSS